MHALTHTRQKLSHNQVNTVRITHGQMKGTDRSSHTPKDRLTNTHSNASANMFIGKNKRHKRGQTHTKANLLTHI